MNLLQYCGLLCKPSLGYSILSPAEFFSTNVTSCRSTEALITLLSVDFSHHRRMACLQNNALNPLSRLSNSNTSKGSKITTAHHRHSLSNDQEGSKRTFKWPRNGQWKAKPCFASRCFSEHRSIVGVLRLMVRDPHGTNGPRCQDRPRLCMCTWNTNHHNRQQQTAR